ncbi:hypothetical protein SAMN05660461_4518 [Chitinophaga ginsengisegetis]|uniref:Uncharacterized protein n=2 Tax=Chitinophaga ginsengisegetis TaxID=393003 RepID=A0A1T5P7G3_9BACT|nr:hypothetical protein SAMN05660461_4518 [Chitinophaga ginsengisegetis]
MLSFANTTMKTLLASAVLILISATSLAQPQNNHTEEKICFLTYGFPDVERVEVEQAIAGKWGFAFYTVGECTIDQALIDSVARVNDAANKRMEARYGSNWRSRYQQEVDAAFATPERAQQLVNQQLYIWRKEQELKMHNDSLHYAWAATGRKGVYKVIVSGSLKNTIFYKLLVDYPKYKVSLLTN